MIRHVKAIYENGVLRPLEPLELAESEVVSLAIDAPANEYSQERTGPTLFDVLDGAGLIGCIKDAPPDLSSNPNHLQGFGNRGE
jgi:predicted DNA-binding antitoxin AbrB/MazE fold protein